MLKIIFILVVVALAWPYDGPKEEKQWFEAPVTSQEIN